MADMNKIMLDNTQLNIVDTTARTTANSANEKATKLDTSGTVTAITSNNTNVVMSNTAKFLIVGNTCYVCLVLQCNADGNQTVTTNLPASRFGNYLYFQNINMDVRVDANGNLRVTRFNQDTATKIFTFCYPVALS